MKIHPPLWLLCTVFVLCGVLYAVTGVRGVQQFKQRSIGRLPIERGEPLRIRAVWVKGTKVKRNEKFVSDNDWLKTLTITVRNASHKRILFASMDLVFPPPPGTVDRLAIDEIDYGNRALLIRPPSAEEMASGVEPDQDIDMQLSAIAYDRIRSLLTEIGHLDTQRVNLKVGRVIFADDSSWYGGNFQRDPDDPRGWINSEISSQAKNTVGMTKPQMRIVSSGVATQDSERMSLQSRLISRWDAPQDVQAYPRFGALYLAASYTRVPQQSAACYKKAWSGNVVCYWGAQCQTKRELTDMTPGGYQFQSANAMCTDVLGNSCGMGSTTVAIPCSFSGGGGGGGGGTEGGGCSSDWDCFAGEECVSGTCQQYGGGFGGLEPE